MIGYLEVSTITKKLDEKMIVIVHLLGEMVITEYKALRKNLSKDSELRSKNDGNHEKLFTSRQLEVLRLMVEGRTEKLIALELEISITTVKYHKKKIYERLNVTCISEVVAKAIKMGIVGKQELC